MSDRRIEGSAQLANAREALVNLLYLIRIDRHHSDMVLQWVEMADGQSKRMESILQRLAPSVADHISQKPS
jgi:hypothetical protein